MKKFLSLLCVIVMAVSLCACGSSNNVTPAPTNSDENQPTAFVHTQAPSVTEAPEESEAPAVEPTPRQDMEAMLRQLAGAQVGDYVTFGVYEQDNDEINGKEGIEWLVLAREDGKLFLISKYGLDRQLYNSENVDVTWETCTLRAWLNNEFFNTAFNSVEQAMILTTEVKADSFAYDMPYGNETEDKVFLISGTEASHQYFASDEARMCHPTAYARAQGVKTGMNMKTSNNCLWWMRSPGVYQNNAVIGTADGGVDAWGSTCTSDVIAVRPVLWVDISSLSVD